METQMAKPISFDEFVSNKRKRPLQTCFKCGKQKEIYTHLNGEEGKPLCNGCNMKLRRESPGAVQVKLLKLCATAIGSVEAMLGLPVEETQKKTLQDMQDELKLMVRAWLGDPRADEERPAATETSDAAAMTTGTASDEFAEARKLAASKASDPVFEAPKTASERSSRKTRKAPKTETTTGAENSTTPTSPANDPAYQTYLEAPLA